MPRPRGYKCSDETKAKIGAGNRARLSDPSFRRKFRAAAREANLIKWNPELDLDLIRRRLSGDTIMEIEAATGFSRVTISGRLDLLASKLRKRRSPQREGLGGTGE